MNWTEDTPSLDDSNANETVADRGTISSELKKRRLFPGTPLGFPTPFFNCAMELRSRETAVGASRALATIEPSSTMEVSMIDNVYDASAAGTFLVPRLVFVTINMKELNMTSLTSLSDIVPATGNVARHAGNALIASSCYRKSYR